MGNIAFSTLEIRALTEALFDRLQRQGLEHIRVPETNYWTVFFTNSFQSTPPKLVIGDVTDDLNDLRGEIESDDAVIWHAFHHLSGLMNLMAHAAEQGDLLPRRQAGKMHQ